MARRLRDGHDEIGSWPLEFEQLERHPSCEACGKLSLLPASKLKLERSDRTDVFKDGSGFPKTEAEALAPFAQGIFRSSAARAASAGCDALEGLGAGFAKSKLRVFGGRFAMHALRWKEKVLEKIPHLTE